MKRLLSLLLLCLPFVSPATTFTVNSLANTNTGAGTSGTLRYCVNQANLSAGPHTINFSVAGTINIAADANVIPTLARAITIDGSTAPGFSGTPVIILNGTGCTAINGLTINAASCQIYGMEIRNFPYRGVHFSSAAASNCIFGAVGRGNVVRNNAYYGIQLSGADNNILAYNKIGVTADGSTCAANGYDGIDLIGGADNNQILSNHVSCNGYNGLQIGNSHFNIVKGNTFGPLNATCSNNGYRGIDIEGGSHDNVIGSTVPGEGNKVSGNLYWGIEVKEAGSIRNIISGNSISCNDYGGIEVNTGGNINIAAPTISTATTTTVTGTSLANSVIEVFRAQDPALILCPMAPTPNNQGVDYLGTTTATAGGTWSLSGTFNGSVVATQRDAAGNTSRFSAAVATGAAATFVSNCPGTVVLASGLVRRFAVVCHGDDQATVELDLAHADDLREVELQQSANGLDFSTLTTLQPSLVNGLHHNISLDQREAVWFRARLVNLDGEATLTEVQGLPAGGCGMQAFSFLAYPNPAADELHVSLQGAGNALVTLSDPQGRVLLQAKEDLFGSSTLHWDVSSVPAGIYLVTLISQQGRVTQKVNVQ
jgi:parallel beta-helix repeat protein